MAQAHARSAAARHPGRARHAVLQEGAEARQAHTQGGQLQLDDSKRECTMTQIIGQYSTPGCDT